MARKVMTKVDEMLTELVSGARVAVRHVTRACRSVPRFGRDLASGGTRVAALPRGVGRVLTLLTPVAARCRRCCVRSAPCVSKSRR